MEEVLKWLGIMLPLALAGMGSSIGCAISGTTLAGALPRAKSGHGALIAMAAAPSSQAIYGIVLMMSLMAAAATLTGGKALAIGLPCGTGIMISAIYQGMCAASGIRATLDDKNVYGKCWIPIGITESFAVFAMVFGILASR